MAAAERDPGGDEPGAGGAETTASLLEQAKLGSESARNRLTARLLPAFRRWAHGRLPARARDLLDTDDLVQVSLVKALNRLNTFEPRHDGAFMAYLRRILINEVRQEIRRCSRRPQRDALDSGYPNEEPSALEVLVGRELLEDYEAALAKLSDAHYDAVVLRVELQLTYEQVAEVIGSPSPNAARMLVKRALLRLAEEMGHVRSDP